MSDLLRVAILGTAHSGDRTPDLTGSEADALVAKLPELERERALLLRAGAEAIMRRAARVLPERRAHLPLAAAETLRASSPQLTAAVRMLLDESEELLAEALARMVRARMRLAPELLPLALDQTDPALRAQLQPVLGERGAWLAQQRSEWAWALGAAADAMPEDFDQRWAEGSAAERRQLFELLRKASPARARELASEAWKHERAEQRAAFVEAFAVSLHADDQPFLTAQLTDRSALVRRAAVRLLWRLPGSDVALRMLARAREHVRFEGDWQVRLPAEPLDPGWIRDGIEETPPAARHLGKRQWWLLQLMASVPCVTWLHGAGAAPQPLVAAALRHELASVLLDGLTRAALKHDERAWFAPLWDAWATSELESTLCPHPRITLSEKLTAHEVTVRAPWLVSDDRLRPLLAYLPRPWPEALALRVLAAISELRASMREAIPVAALGIPVELLPDALPLPDSRQVDYPLRAYVRALDQFQQVAALRRSIAAETARDR